MPCGGITITSNTFTNNFGCPVFGGAVVSLRCDDVNANYTGLILD